MRSTGKCGSARPSTANHGMHHGNAQVLPPAIRELADLLAELACQQLNPQPSSPVEVAPSGQKGNCP